VGRGVSPAQGTGTGVVPSQAQCTGARRAGIVRRWDAQDGVLGSVEGVAAKTWRRAILGPTLCQ
jgi:hypothetical protein